MTGPTKLTRPSDTLLAEAARQGDRQAFGELVGRHWEGVVRIVTRIAGDRPGAEDTAQDAFVRAWQRLGAFRPEGSFRNWVYTIAVHLALDTRRRDRPTSDLDEYDPRENLPGPEAALESRQQAQQIRQAVQALPQACRAVLVLREYEGLSYSEIAGALDIPVGTVMSRLSYARAQLRRSLATILAEE